MPKCQFWLFDREIKIVPSAYIVDYSDHDHFPFVPSAWIPTELGLLFVYLYVILANDQFCNILTSLSLQTFTIEVAYICFVLIEENNVRPTIVV